MILVGSTMAAFCTDQDDTSLAWLYNAEAIRDSHPEGVEFFAALELDGRGLEPFAKVLERLDELGGSFYTYRYDDGRERIETGNRLWHLAMGRNIMQDRAMDRGATHLLSLDADMCPPADCLPKLLELAHPLVGGHVPTYGLRGPRVFGCQFGSGRYPTATQVDDADRYPEAWDVQDHMNTAGFLLIARLVFNRIRWRWSLDDGQTDDPCYERDAREFLGIPTYVRHDVVGQHMPESIVRIEDRFPDRDMKVYA